MQQKTGANPSTGGHGNGNSTGIAAEGPLRTNADVLAKALLDINLLLDIGKVLAEELPGKRRPVHAQILTIIDGAGAVSAAEGIQSGFRGLSLVK